VLIVAVEFLALVGFAYWIFTGGPSTTGRLTALLISAVAALAAYDGARLAIREQDRAYNGRVTMGVVVGKMSSTGAAKSRRSPWRYRRGLGIGPDGFGFHDELGRLILTGSVNAWIIEYRYDCDRPRGCWGRDFVPEPLWRRLHVDQTVNVRRGSRETGAGRLDENPMWGAAIVDLAFAAVLLLAAGVISGRLTAPRRRVYLTAPAVVTAVEPVKYRDVTRWRIRFAYFDPHGAAQESADEVVTAEWKPGDDCLAVFQPERPDIATFRPARVA
jgi:hypothetical protein